MYRVGELARAAGVNPRTVDYYTRIGLLNPETRTEHSYRLYTQACLQRLRLIQELRGRKYSLEQIRALLDKQEPDAIADAARLQSELDHLLGAITGLKGIPLDEKSRAVLTALAAKGMALTHQLFLLLHGTEL